MGWDWQGGAEYLESENEVAHSCWTLCYPIDCSLSGFSVLGIFQARVLEWVAISFSRGSSRPRGWTQVSCIAGRLFIVWATREATRKGRQTLIWGYLRSLLFTGDSPKLHVEWRREQGVFHKVRKSSKQVREKYSEIWVIIVNGILFTAQVRPGEGCNI